jgi:pSer/pThr/pTyr-binding forkhead associated (FHA) protein
MKVSLVVMSQGKDCGKSIPITLSQFLIGRDPQCQLRPSSVLISKRHCGVLVKNGKVLLRDFGSTNGTYVNDEVVQAECQLNHDDVLKVGPLTFRVQIDGPVPVDKPTPPPPKPKAADDDSIAAMLLSLQDGETPPADSEAKSEEVPSGTTLMDVPAVAAETAETEEVRAGEEAPEAEAKDKEKEKKAEPAKSSTGATANAAAALLSKYARRNRS